MPVSFAILAQTFPAENNTANEEASTDSVIGMIDWGLSWAKPFNVAFPHM